LKKGSENTKYPISFPNIGSARPKGVLLINIKKSYHISNTNNKEKTRAKPKEPYIDIFVLILFSTLDSTNPLCLIECALIDFRYR
jgi:hypothetical protein